MRRALLALSRVIGISLVLAAPALAFDEVVERTFPLPAGGVFELTNINGSVRVDAWDQERVHIYAVKSARVNQDDLRRVAVEINAQQPGRISVETRYSQDESVEVTVEYRIRVPRKVVLGHLTTVNGNIRVTGVDGSGDLRSVNGNIELFDGRGGFSARTTNGSLHLEYRYFESAAPISLEVMNGVIVLALPPRADADIDVSSLNGDFASELPLRRRTASDSREFRARLGRGGPVIKLRTVNGGIRVVAVQSAV